MFYLMLITFLDLSCEVIFIGFFVLG